MLVSSAGSAAPPRARRSAEKLLAGWVPATVEERSPKRQKLLRYRAQRNDHYGEHSANHRGLHNDRKTRYQQERGERGAGRASDL